VTRRHFTVWSDSWNSFCVPVGQLNHLFYFFNGLLFCLAVSFIFLPRIICFIPALLLLPAFSTDLIFFTIFLFIFSHLVCFFIPSSVCLFLPSGHAHDTPEVPGMSEGNMNYASG
jgi:hypothetical protein